MNHIAPKTDKHGSKAIANHNKLVHMVVLNLVYWVLTTEQRTWLNEAHRSRHPMPTIADGIIVIMYLANSRSWSAVLQLVESDS